MFSPAARYGPFTRYEASGNGEGLAGSRLARTPVRRRIVLKGKKQPWEVCPPFSAVRVKFPGAQVTGVLNRTSSMRCHVFRSSLGSFVRQQAAMCAREVTLSNMTRSGGISQDRPLCQVATQAAR